jgi:hypothetical protein
MQVAEEGVGECTSVPAPYHVADSSLTVWDLPGWGTPANPTETYFMDKKLYAFDGILIIYAGRPSEGVPMIIAGCREFGVSFAIVRNKADADIERWAHTSIQASVGRNCPGTRLGSQLEVWCTPAKLA